MGYYNFKYYDSLMHSEQAKKRDLNGTSISTEKGTDNKANNTSAYNHEYYMKHKDKWGVKGETGTQKDFDDFDKLTESDRVGDSDFFAKKNDDGTWTIYEEDMVWRLPKGVEVDADMRKALSDFKGFQDPSIKTHQDWDDAVNKIINAKNKGDAEFDTDAAAMDVIRGKYGNGQARKDALGDDYASVQKRVNEIMKGKSSGGTAVATDASGSSSAPAADSSNKSASAPRGTAWYNNYTNKIADTKASNAQKAEDKKRAAEQAAAIKKEAEEKAAAKAAKEAKKKKS